MYRGKRSQVTQLTSDLQGAKTQLGVATDKLEGLQREMALLKVSAAMHQSSLISAVVLLQYYSRGWFHSEIYLMYLMNKSYFTNVCTHTLYQKIEMDAYN